MTMTLNSAAFGPLQNIPVRYTCDGENISPPLTWSEIPNGARSLVLIIEDPDAPDPAAPRTTWVHWILYNLPADTGGLVEAVKVLPEGTLEGRNDWKRIGYDGPCPPIGRHRYFHKLFALDTKLPDLGQPTRATLERAMENHVLECAELVGNYQRASR